MILNFSRELTDSLNFSCLLTKSTFGTNYGLENYANKALGGLAFLLCFVAQVLVSITYHFVIFSRSQDLVSYRFHLPVFFLLSFSDNNNLHKGKQILLIYITENSDDTFAYLMLFLMIGRDRC